MRKWRMLLFGIGMLLLCSGTIEAQKKGRPGRRPGEINTRPARGERYRDKVKVGDAAPDFALADPTGKKEIKLSSYQGKKPVVLIFGSYT